MLAEYIDFIHEHRDEVNFIETALNELNNILPYDERTPHVTTTLLNMIMDEEVQIGDDIYINYLSHRVYYDGSPVDLSKNETKIIEILAKKKGGVVTYKEIIDKIWGYAEDNAILKVNISHIRNKLNIPIVSVKGIGYKLGG